MAGMTGAKSCGIIVEAMGGRGEDCQNCQIGNPTPASQKRACWGPRPPKLENVMMEDRYGSEHPREQRKTPEARYAYYRRCQVFRRNGEQCKAPAVKGAHICYAHAGQLATAVRRERERRAVLVEASAEMRRRGRPEFEMADLFMDFKGIQVTLAVMAQALIDGRIDCRTEGRLAVELQTFSRLLWQIHRKGRKKDLPLINTGNTDRKKLPKAKTLPRIHADATDQTPAQQAKGKQVAPPAKVLV